MGHTGGFSMRTLVLAAGAFALWGFTLPAHAQMCGPGQQAQASSSGGMMCGMMGQAAEDPMADKPAQKPQQSTMCPCCRNMAMMRGGMMQHHNMPGMDAPKQQ
jgi:hypothetical protein